MECRLMLSCVGGEGFAFVGVREKWSLRFVVGPRIIPVQNTDKYLYKFSVPRGGAKITENEKQKKNADKGAHGFLNWQRIANFRNNLKGRCQYALLCHFRSLIQTLDTIGRHR